MTNIRHDYPELVGLKPQPVMQVQCPVCQGSGWKESHVDELGGHGARCVWCSGQGFYWTEVDHAQ